MESSVKVGELKLRYLEYIMSKSDSPFSKNTKHNHGRHLLFIHGLGSSSDRWLDIPEALSLLGFHTIALDLPGFGGSDKPPVNYTVDYFSNVVTDFIRQIKLDDGRTSLIGHSLGGYIAAKLAADNKMPTDKLVLIDTSGMLQKPTPLLKEYASAAMKPSNESVRRVLEQMVADPIRIPEMLVNAFIYRISQPSAQAAFQSAYENSVNTQIGIEKLKCIRNPTLIIWGKEDRLIPLRYSQIFEKEIENSTSYLVSDAGHAPFAEKPAIVSGIIRMFLEA